MLITALVQFRRNTLVMDLPRDSNDLYLKLTSIGIDTSADEVRIVDDEDVSDISVKLFGESDVGRYHSLLFNEKHSLDDVNSTAWAVENCEEEIRDELERNIVNDPYETPEQLLADIKRMTEAIGEYTETFYFPLTAQLEDDEACWSDLNNRYLLQYEYAIRERLEFEQELGNGESIKDYFYDDDNAQKKMVSCKWDVVERDRVLYGKVDFRLREPFTAEEKELVRRWVSGQNSDGFGEGVEQRAIQTEDGDLYVSLWNSSDDYFVYDEDEMNEYLSLRQEGLMYQ